MPPAPRPADAGSFLEWCEAVRRHLHRPLPGLAAQRRMAPRPRASHVLWPREDELRAAAVAVLLFPVADDPQGSEPGLVLTRRPQSMARHRGQVCLPGGVLDQGEDAVQAALREVREEIGVEATDGQVLGCLSPMVIPVSRFQVTPVVVALSAQPRCTPDPREVEEVYLVPLRQLFAPDARGTRTERRPDGPIQIPYYRWAEQDVWGATAMMLAELHAVAWSDAAEPR